MEIQMKVCSLTDIGMHREMNQDYLYTSAEPVGKLPNLFMTADGMGGHNAGEFASGNAIKRIVRSVQKNRKLDEISILRDAIREANSYIKHYADLHTSMQGMGTTLVAATIREGHMVVANIGDSRLYVIEPDRTEEVFGFSIRQVTRDHSLVQEMVRMGELDASKAKDHRDKNIITRAVGVAPEVEPDFFEVDLVPGSTVLLCTDGLSNMIDNREIQSIVCGGGDLTDRTRKLIDRANEMGGKDNITVILIETDQDEVIS